MKEVIDVAIVVLSVIAITVVVGVLYKTMSIENE